MNHEYQSVWDAIEEDPIKSADLKFRSVLMMAIAEYLKATGMTQFEAAKKLGSTRSQVNNVLKGKIEKCNVTSLLNMATSAGFKVDLTLPHVD